MHVEGAAAGVHGRGQIADPGRDRPFGVGIGHHLRQLPGRDRRQVLLVQRQEDLAASGAGDLQQGAPRLHQIARLHRAALHDAVDLGVDPRARQRHPRRLQALAQHLLLASALGQRRGGQTGPLMGHPRHDLGTARLLAQLDGQQPAHVEGVAPLPLAGGLIQVGPGFAQQRLGLRAGRLQQLLQRRLGFAHPGPLLVVAQLQQQVAGLHRIALAHITDRHHAGDFAADLGDRLATHLAAGHHPLHQRAQLQAIAGQLRTLPLAPDEPAGHQHRQQGEAKERRAEGDGHGTTPWIGRDGAQHSKGSPRAGPGRSPGPHLCRRRKPPRAQSMRSNFRSQTPWPRRSPRRSNLVTGRSSGRGT